MTKKTNKIAKLKSETNRRRSAHSTHVLYCIVLCCEHTKRATAPFMCTRKFIRRRRCRCNARCVFVLVFIQSFFFLLLHLSTCFFHPFACSLFAQTNFLHHFYIELLLQYYIWVVRFSFVCWLVRSFVSVGLHRFLLKQKWLDVR